jgi:hypothetical protein
VLAAIRPSRAAAVFFVVGRSEMIRCFDRAKRRIVIEVGESVAPLDPQPLVARDGE